MSTFFTLTALLVLMGIGCVHTTRRTTRTARAQYITLHAASTTRSAFVLLLRRRRADVAAPSSAERAGHTPSQDGTTSHLDFEQNDLILRRQSSSNGCCARRCSEGYCRGGRRLLPWCAPAATRAAARLW